MGFDFRLMLGLAALAWMLLIGMRSGPGRLIRHGGSVAWPLHRRHAIPILRAGAPLAVPAKPHSRRIASRRHSCTRIIDGAHEAHAYPESWTIRRRGRSMRVIGSHHE